MIKRVVSSLVLVALVASAVLVYASTREETEFYTVSADVEQAPNLFENGRVMVRGVEVGRISDVSPQPNGVRVTMEIEEGVRIPSDARLSIVPITVIADRYVQFTPAYTGGPALEDGDHLVATRTSIPAELDDVLKQLKELLATIEPKDDRSRGPIAKLVRDVDYIVRGRVGNLRGSIRNSSSFLKNLATSSNEIEGVIRNLDELFITLAARRSDIGLVNERFRLIAESLEVDRENLEGTIENVTSLSEESRQLFRESGDELGLALDRTATVVQGVLDHQDALAEGFRWTNVLSEALGATDKSGRGLYAYSGRQAPPGTPRAAYNYRLDTRDTIACERIDELAQSIQGGGFGDDPATVFNAILAFTPEEYHEDLTYLFRLLMPPCTGIDFETTSLTERAERAVEKAVKKVGEDHFRAAVGIWLLESIAAGDIPARPDRGKAKAKR